MDQNEATNRDRLAARLTRGSQPARGRVKGKRFSKVNQPKRGRGRPKGSRNVMTRILSEAALLAAENVGNKFTMHAADGPRGLVGYLEWVAEQHPPVFMQLLGRVMPLQVQVEDKPEVHYKTVEEVHKALEEHGIPIRAALALEHHESEDDILEGEILEPEERPNECH